MIAADVDCTRVAGAAAVLAALRGLPLAFDLNSGGPSSRTRQEHLRASVLGKGGGAIRCPRVVRVALEFGRARPVAAVERLLAVAGAATAEELRSRYDIPSSRLVGRPLPESAKRLKVASAAPDEVLRQALMLGLCTSQLYDPRRPILWTDASLTRGLELFDPAGFYA